MKPLDTIVFLHRLLRLTRTNQGKTPVRFFLLLIAVSMMAQSGYAQHSNTITGTVKDAVTGEPIPFANVFFSKFSQGGTQTNLEGKFAILRSKTPGDTLLLASFIGYKTDTLSVGPGQNGSIHFALRTTATQLKEVVISSGENPAYAIIRQAVANKDRNNPQKLEAYQMESYNRVEVYLNRTDGIKNAKVVKEIKAFMERQPGNKYRDPKGNVIIPLTVTETVSTNYFLKHPQSTKEEVLHTNTAGVGLEAEDGLTRLLSGNSFRNFNFYENRIQILDKWLPSPIADGWRFNYEYFLEDSVLIGNEWSYRISVEPRRETDIAFFGTVWINRNTHGLTKLDLQLTENANINFVQALHIQQEAEPDASGAWFPTLTDYQISLKGDGKMPGIWLKTHTANAKFVANQPKPLAFFLESRYVDPEAQLPDDSYWQEYRETATDTMPGGAEAFVMIDSIKHLPTASKYAFWGRTLTTGFMKAGKIDIGHLLFSYAWNNVEGNRMSMGFRTNADFSKQLFLDGWGAYGAFDKRFKYNLSASYVFSQKHFTLLGVRRRDDTEPITQLSPDFRPTQILKAFNRWGDMRARNPYQYRESMAWFEHEVRPGLSAKVVARNLSMKELFPMGVPLDQAAGQPTQAFTTSEAEVSIRFSRKDRSFRTRYNKVKIIGPQPSPVITLMGVFGLKDLAGSDFNYQKLILNIAQKQVPVLGFGTAEYAFQAGYIFSPIPYSLLKVHQGNNSSFYFYDANQLMRTFEFVSDHYVELHYTHYFNSLIFSQIPGIRSLNKKLDWRLLVSTNIVWGGMRKENIAYNLRQSATGEPVLPFQTLGHTPYIEVGYGVENIFHFLRIDFMHRLTYRNTKEASRFGIKLSAAVKL